MAKKGLGRGLGALLGGKKATPNEASSEEAQIPPSTELQVELGSPLEIQIEKLHPCPSQPRKSFERQPLEELAESIKANGIIQPLIVRTNENDQFQIIAGERRWRAAQIAGLKTVPVVIRTANDTQVLEMALVENLQRENLNPIEEAEGYALLIEAFNLTQEATAQRVGKSRASVANALRLLNLPEEVLAHLKTERLSVGHAKVILGAESAEHQKLIAEKAIKQSLSVRQTEELIDNLKNGSPTHGKKKTRNDQEVHVTSLENRLREKLGTKVSLTYREGKGTLTIKYFSDEDLERVLKLLEIQD